MSVTAPLDTLSRRLQLKSKTGDYIWLRLNEGASPEEIVRELKQYVAELDARLQQERS